MELFDATEQCRICDMRISRQSSGSFINRNLSRPVRDQSYNSIDTVDKNLKSQFEVYYFTPTRHMPRFALYNKPYNPNNSIDMLSLQAIISRQCLIVVGTKQSDWYMIFVGNIHGYSKLDIIQFDTKHFKKLNQIHRYLSWEGNNIFLCNGKVMFGCDYKQFIATNIAIIIPSILVFLGVLRVFPVNKITKIYINVCLNLHER